MRPLSLIPQRNFSLQQMEINYGKLQLIKSDISTAQLLHQNLRDHQGGRGGTIPTNDLEATPWMTRVGEIGFSPR